MSDGDCDCGDSGDCDCGDCGDCCDCGDGDCTCCDTCCDNSGDPDCCGCCDSCCSAICCCDSTPDHIHHHQTTCWICLDCADAATDPVITTQPIRSRPRSRHQRQQQNRVQNGEPIISQPLMSNTNAHVPSAPPCNKELEKKKKEEEEDPPPSYEQATATA